MTNERTNFTIHNDFGLANSGVLSTRFNFLCDMFYSVGFAGITSCRPINNTTETPNPSYLEVIAKYKSHDMTHKVNYHE